MLLTGEFDTSGSPTLKIKIAGPGSEQEYIATIDTGFTGFVALPLMEMVTLRLKSESATKVRLGDGSVVDDLMAQGSVILPGKIEQGGILLFERYFDWNGFSAKTPADPLHPNDLLSLPECPQ